MEKIKGIVRASTDPKEWNGVIQIGFTLEADPKKWYNISGEEAELKRTKDTLLKKGNDIEFEIDNGKIDQAKITVIKEGKGSWEDDIVDFETLLTAAHEKKVPFSIKTECINVDLEKKYALFKASVIVSGTKVGELESGETTFDGHGDSTAENVTGEFIKPHFIRMAETRAIVRALRWYTNNAKCAEEEKSNSESDEKK